MTFKIKTRPEDFIVEEMTAPFPLLKKGPYGVYLLKKANWNTVELLRFISRKLNIHPSVVSYGGRKDRHSLSSQYITVKSRNVFDLEEKDFSLKFIGFMDRPMGPDLLIGNRFEVVLRNLDDEEIRQAVSGIKTVQRIGCPNYFDDQRFGSFDPRQGFLAEKVLKAQFNGALKIYLTCARAQDKKEERDRKAYFFDHWKDWPACLVRARTGVERKTFQFLLSHPTAFLNVLKAIPHEELTVYFSAFQGYLWNEALRKMIRTKIPGSYLSVKGMAGDYLFYADLAAPLDSYFEHLSLPVPGTKLKITDSFIQGVYDDVLGSCGLRQALFNRQKLRQAFLKSFDRSAIFRPQELSFDIGRDEIVTQKQKIVLRFWLTPGSYATMFIKRIMSKDEN